MKSQQTTVPWWNETINDEIRNKLRKERRFKTDDLNYQIACGRSDTVKCMLLKNRIKKINELLNEKSQNEKDQ